MYIFFYILKNYIPISSIHDRALLGEKRYRKFVMFVACNCTMMVAANDADHQIYFKRSRFRDTVYIELYMIKIHVIMLSCSHHVRL